ncbi:peptidase families S8 and S53 domain protein [Verrucomicrobiia bacterium DG1235]|nr:peptidase families S8 and S53 domain protein [Verrucomicrobiae bacterium DG1235]
MKKGLNFRWLLGAGLLLCVLVGVVWWLVVSQSSEVEEGRESLVAVSEVLEIPGVSPGADSFDDEVASPIEAAGEVIVERLAGREGGASFKRVSLVETEGFDFPIRVERSVERDLATGEERTVGFVEMAADRVIVRFVEGVGEEVLRERFREYDLRLGRRLMRAPVFELIFAEATIDAVPEGMARLYGSDLGVVLAYVEPNYIVHTMVAPDDPSFVDGSLWGLHNTGQEGGVVDVDIDAPEGWDIRSSAEGIVVAVIDTGINYLHQDLAPNVWVNALEIPGNGIDDDENGFVDDVHGINVIRMDGDPMDDNGHGTHCSGTIGARGNDGVGVTGVAWDVQLMGAKFLSKNGSGTTADAIACIDYAVTMGADILSNSWGGGAFSQSLYDAISEAEANGVAFVAAAGNAASDIDKAPAYPAAYELGNVVSVASVDRRGDLSVFSNYGPENVDVSAPGSSILSSWIGGESAYETISGTSMATPHASGILALLMAEYPEDGLGDNLGRLFYGSRPLTSLEDRVGSGGLVSLASSLGLAEVPQPPRFRSRPPRNVYAPVGASLALEAEVESELPVTYQWFFEGEALAGESAARLDLVAVSLVQAGVYRFEASNEDRKARASSTVAVLESEQLLGEAWDASILPVYTYGDAEWSVYSFDSVIGGSSVRSGPIDDGGESAIFTEVSGPGRVSFFWRVSAEPFWDYGQFLVDGELLSSLRSEDDWVEQSFDLEEARVYRMEWRYVKDVSGAEGQDALFVDGLMFSAGGEGPPVILGQPEGAVLGGGATYTLSVEAVGEGLRYQWLKDGIELSGETDSTYRLLADGDDKAGEYIAVVSNEYGEARSLAARIRIADIAVSIERQPRDLQLDVGQSGIFEAKVSGSLPLSMQWYRDGIALEGEVLGGLRIESARLDDAGEYVLRVSNAFTSEPMETEAAVLQVRDVSLAPKFVKQPRSGYWQTGEPFQLSGVVEGTFPFSYRWFKDGVELEGETERVLALESAELEDGGVYVLEARNALGTARSEGARVRILGDVTEALDLEGVEWQVEGDAYFFVQSDYTFDGVDALQSSSETSFLGVATLLETQVVGPINFSLYWKQDTAAAASRMGLYVDNKLGAVLNSERDWHRVTVWVPEGIHSVKVSGLLEVGSTVWLDKASLDTAPFLYHDSGSPALEVGDPLYLWADVKGPGTLSYQWFRNGLPLRGHVGNEYRVSTVKRKDSGIYRLEVSSEYGLRRGPNFRVRVVDDLAEDVGDGSVDLELSEGKTWKGLVRADGNTVLRSGEGQEDIDRELAGVVEGPGVLVFDLGIRSEDCCTSVALRVDGREVARYTDTQTSEALTKLTQRAVWIGEGQHLVNWRFARGSGGPPRSREAYLDNIRVTQAPVVVRHPRGLRVVEGEEATLEVSALGQGEFTYRWFKDGELIEGEESRILVIAESGSSDAGLYHCVVSNAAGLTATSSEAELVVVTGFYEALGLDYGRLVVGGAEWEPREGVFPGGGLALSYMATTASSFSSLAFDIEVPDDERRGIAFWIRTSGMSEGSRVRVVENAGKQWETRENSEWQRVVLPLAKTGLNRLTLNVVKSVGLRRDELEVYLSGFELVEEPLIYSQPQSGSRYWGESIEFVSDVTGREPMTYQWSRDGVALEGSETHLLSDARLRIGKVRDADAAHYKLGVENGLGTIESDEAVLAVLTTDYGEAVGTPGTAVWSEGGRLWTVDESDAAIGQKSLSVSGLEPQSESDLVFWIRGPGVMSLYWKLDTPSGGDRMSLLVSGQLVSGIVASSEWERYELRVDEQFYQVRVRMSNLRSEEREAGTGWVDSIRFQNDGALTFGDWAAGAFAGTDLPDSERGLEGDPDEDGVVNFVEYALAQSPLSKTKLPVLRRFDSGDSAQVLVDFSLEAWADDIAFGLEASRDLETWYPLRSEFLVTFDEEEGYEGTLLYDFDDRERLESVFTRMAIYYIGNAE